MNPKLIVAAMTLGVILSLMFIWNNQNPSKKGKVYTSGDINFPGRADSSTNEKPATIIAVQAGDQAENLTPQVGDVRKVSNSDKIKTNMSSYQAELIQIAEILIDRVKSIPPSVDPVVETNGDFVVVFWPIPREGSNMVPRPSKYAAVHFRKGTLDVEGVLGAH